SAPLIAASHWPIPPFLPEDNAAAAPLAVKQRQIKETHSMFADTAAPDAGTNQARPNTDVSLRKPDGEDGSKLHALVKRCKPLDENSLYCNLLQCTHFADTCVAAELDGELVGFISAYIPPKQ